MKQQWFKAYNIYLNDSSQKKKTYTKGEKLLTNFSPFDAILKLIHFSIDYNFLYSPIALPKILTLGNMIGAI
jgi:hypothetical protein